MNKMRCIKCGDRLQRMPELVTGQANTTYFLNRNVNLLVSFAVNEQIIEVCVVWARGLPGTLRDIKVAENKILSHEFNLEGGRQAEKRYILKQSE